MNARRKFVIQGALATAAFMVSKPLELLAGVAPSSKKIATNSNCLTLLHSAEPELMVQSEFMTYVSKANRIASPIVLNASDNTVNNNQIHLHKEAFNSRYSILNQGGVITGFITITADEANGTQTLNELATYLKQEKKCNLVVCVSQLGFKNKTGLDDLTLAATSENIDIILGGNTANFTTKTMVVRNNKKEEVIIQSSFSTHLPCGKLEIAFDEAGNKKHIHVATKFYNDTIGALV